MTHLRVFDLRFFDQNIDMATRTANAQWNGDLKAGKGEMKFPGYSGPYSFQSRMEEGDGTNPEELIAAALAGCYSMALSAGLSKAGFVPDQVATAANASFENVNGDWTITTIRLDVNAKVPNVDDAKFQEIANGTKSGCPVSRALTGVKIEVNAKLV